MFLLKIGKSLGNCLFTCTGAMKYGHIFLYLSGHVDCKMFMLCSIPPDRGRFRNSVSRLQRWTLELRPRLQQRKLILAEKIFEKKTQSRTESPRKQPDRKNHQKKNEFSSVFFCVFCWCFVFCFWLFCFCFFFLLVFWFVFCLLWFCFVKKKTMKPYILCAVGVLILERSALPPHVW